MERQRLDKIIASTGKWSRREVRELARRGLVTVDGAAVRSVEEKFDPEAAEILVKGEALAYRRYTWIMLNKPAGVLSATEDPRQETVLDLLPEQLRRRGLFPVGRLDKDTEGLLLLTDDGTFAQRLAHPSHRMEKEYHVTVTGRLEDCEARLAALRSLEDGSPIAPARVRTVADRKGRRVLSVTIHQGRNRQVRRMCALAELRVERLVRVREATLVLGDLPAGRWRPLTGEERAALLG